MDIFISMKTFLKYGLNIPEILLPKTNIDMNAWSVIACDQYTQDRDYWTKAEKIAENKPSTLNIILPEVYLSDEGKSERISKIREKMNEYLGKTQEDSVFQPAKKGLMYIERKTGYGRLRKGLVTAIDLETYEWKPFSKALIRATEATIVERIPPRMEIRRGASIETPHIMLLVNDPSKKVVEETGKLAKDSRKPTYDTDLMLNAGHISGWIIDSDKELESLQQNLDKVFADNTASDGSTFMFAVGDGNHSLATAKAVWDELKEKNGGIKNADGTISIPKGFENHNARFALIEIVNIYDDGLTFEPIHRVMFNANNEQLISFLKDKLNGEIETCKNAEELEKIVSSSKNSFGFVLMQNGQQTFLHLKTPITELAVSKLQPAIDQFIVTQTTKPEIDYIHGSEEVFRLGAKENTIAILLPPIAKDSFFTTISGSGPLPRKSFSMGEASEKRFYLECRKLF